MTEAGLWSQRIGSKDSSLNMEDSHARGIQRQVLRYQPRGKGVASPRLLVCSDAWTLEAGLRGWKVEAAIVGEEKESEWYGHRCGHQQ